MRVLITCGASFIGGNLCARLCADRRIDSVTVLNCLTTGRRSNLAGLDIEFMDGSVRDREVVAAAVGNADAVVHLAAQVSVAASADDPVGTHEVNATGTLNVLEAARRAGTAQVIVASSAAVYGDALRSPTDESVPTSPRTIYGSSKLAAEAHALAYGASLGVGTLALRFFNVFGPLQRPDSSYAAVIPAFVSAAVDGRPVTVNGDGAQTRDFVYVGTVRCDRGRDRAVGLSAASGQRRVRDAHQRDRVGRRTRRTDRPACATRDGFVAAGRRSRLVRRHSRAASDIPRRRDHPLRRRAGRHLPLVHDPTRRKDAR
jgi:UDP-glucose 4-epimerase